MTRTPLMDSCRWALTSPMRLRTLAYERADLVRNTRVPASSTGSMVRVASASRQSSTSRKTTAPIRVSRLVTRLVTPSVTSWSMASMSFVRRLTIQPVFWRLKKSRLSFWMCAKRLRRRSSSMRSPTQLTK